MELVDLHNAQENDALFTTFLHQIREKYELDHAAYAGMNPISGTTHGHVTYSSDWTAHYFQNKFHEIDPTLAVLRQCALDAEADAKTDELTKSRIQEMLQFVERTTTWYEQMRQVPKPVILKLMKLGSKIVKFVPK